MLNDYFPSQVDDKFDIKSDILYPHKMIVFTVYLRDSEHSPIMLAHGRHAYFTISQIKGVMLEAKEPGSVNGKEYNFLDEAHRRELHQKLCEILINTTKEGIARDSPGDTGMTTL
jgi:hypothetical protein